MKTGFYRILDDSKLHQEEIMKPVLVIGSTCVDIIINIDHLPKTQENLRPTAQSMALGGCAYNVAYVMNLFRAPHTRDGMSPSICRNRKTAAATVWWKPPGSAPFSPITGWSTPFRRIG